jgi:hypothetical protein
MRKVRESDRKLLAQVFQDHGADWTYKALAVWYAPREVPFRELAKVKRWTDRRLAAFRFLRELIGDYTPNAIYGAAEGIEKSAHQAA